jgi:hypothetical protein
MCLVAVSEKPFCLRLSLTETKRVNASGCETYSRPSERSCGLSFQVLIAPVNTEWELNQAVFQSIVLHWGNPNIDLFATSLNFKVTTFVSPVPDPRAYAVDAMSLSWEGMFAYAFPPFRFLVPVLHKITEEKCRIIIIAPAGPKQAWFANLLCLSASVNRVRLGTGDARGNPVMTFSLCSHQDR